MLKTKNSDIKCVSFRSPQSIKKFLFSKRVEHPGSTIPKNMPKNASRPPSLQSGKIRARNTLDKTNINNDEAGDESSLQPSCFVNGLEESSQVEAAQEVQQYYAQRAPASKRYFGKKKGSSGLIPFKDQIDTVDKHLTAKLRLKELMRDLNKSELAGKEALCAPNSGLDIVNPSRDDIKLFMANTEAIRTARLRKKITDVPPYITVRVCTALRYLHEKCEFFDVQKYKGIEPVMGCGAFFVEKSNGKLRIILDGRYANVFFDPNYSSFSFFTLETLSHVIGNLGRNHEKWYAANFDLRHWFHQIPLPPIFRQYLGMSLTDNDNEYGDYWLFPRSLPMGWIYAPYLAQCATWSLLFTEPINNGLDIDKEYLKKLYDCPEGTRKTPPTWIPLTSGGGVFVFLDNILVLSPFKSTCERWYSKIVNNCRKYHAILKGLDETTYDNGNFESDAQTLRNKENNCFIELSKNSPTTGFEFLGIKWTHHERTIVLKEEDKPETFKEGVNTSSGEWHGSRRDMAGILGKIMWYRRVHGIQYFDEDTRDQSRAILHAYSKLTPEHNVKGEWDKPFSLSSSDARLIGDAWNLRYSRPTSHNPGFESEINQPTDLVFTVTDASTGKAGQGGRTAGMAYSPLTEFGHLLPADETRLPANEKLGLKVGKFHGRIARGEMLAIRDIVLSVCNQEVPPKLIILATDNMNCKHWVERGHCHHDDINDMLADVMNALKKIQCRLYVTYVPTDENFADAPTRDKPLDRSCLKKTHQRLLSAFAEATTGMWKLAGGNVGGTQQKMSNDEKQDH